jgi:hypothetical protein
VCNTRGRRKPLQVRKTLEIEVEIGVKEEE